jgi:hypothetical protein
LFASIARQAALLRDKLKQFGYPKEITDKDISNALKLANYNANYVHQYFMLKSNGLMVHPSFEAWNTARQTTARGLQFKYEVFKWSDSFDTARINEEPQQEVLIREALDIFCPSNDFSWGEVAECLDLSDRDANSVYQYFSMRFNKTMKFDSFEAWRGSDEFSEDYRRWFVWSLDDSIEQTRNNDSNTRSTVIEPIESDAYDEFSDGGESFEKFLE